MELIMVNSLKLKIILTPEDMRELNITNETLDYGLPDTRKAFKSILERAREETGFDIKSDKVYVRIFPSPDGGCEMFLTRRSNLMPEPAEEKCTYFKKKYRFSGEDGKNRKEYIAESTELDNIIELCLRMRSAGFRGKSALYSLGENYYLTVCFPGRMPSFMKDYDIEDDVQKYSFMSEYAYLSYAAPLAKAYIEEYADIIIENGAVDRLAESFGR